MKTPYVSIDIETTGLDPDYCQVIEFGAVFDDWVTPIGQLPRFQTYVFHNRITGQPGALQMNAAILKKLADVERDMHGRDYLNCQDRGSYVRPKALCAEFAGWLRKQLVDPRKAIVVAGKNFSGFDRQFLERLHGWNIPFCHRVIDPAMLYWVPGKDATPPSTQECLVRASIPGNVKHTALEDALDVVRLIRAKFAI